MKRFRIILFLIIASLSNCFSQSTKINEEIVETSSGWVKEIRKEYFNNKGQITKRTTREFGHEGSLVTSEFAYNPDGTLCKEKFYSKYCFTDSLSQKNWNDTSTISTEYYEYNGDKELINIRDFSFQCGNDTCDITRIFYSNGLKTQEYKSPYCSLPEFNIKITYKYDEDNNLVKKVRFGHLDTTIISSIEEYKYDFLNRRTEIIRYENKNDSLQLDEHTNVEWTESKNRTQKKLIHKIDNSFEIIEYNEDGKISLYEDYNHFWGNEYYLFEREVYKYRSDGTQKKTLIYNSWFKKDDKKEVTLYEIRKYKTIEKKT